jgi:hypothetical protein
MNTNPLRTFEGVASALVESRSLEAEIADCRRAICWAMEPEVAMANWVRLRNLTERKIEAENCQFIRETKNGELNGRTR